MSQAATNNATAVTALVLSAALWGVSWYPYRLLAEQGLNGLWALVATQLVAALLCLLVFGSRLADLRLTPALLTIGLLGGATNTGFVLGTLQGEVLRVTLLLYLAPLWTIFLSRWFLDERINAAGLGVVALALIGAVIMLVPIEWISGDQNKNLHGFNVADALGLAAGLTYAGYNVSVRRAADASLAHKTFAASLGSGVVALLLLPFSIGVLTRWPGTATLTSTFVWLLVSATGALLLLVAMLMQYGLMRLSATRAIVILVSELVFAAASAWWLADEYPGRRELLGGALILAASLLSSKLGQVTDGAIGPKSS